GFSDALQPRWRGQQLLHASAKFHQLHGSTVLKMKSTRNRVATRNQWGQALTGTFLDLSQSISIHRPIG
ncbi:MAG: hypothetical protein AAF234_20370, partial [Pseudomonadota bacterium]